MNVIHIRHKGIGAKVTVDFGSLPVDEIFEHNDLSYMKISDSQATCLENFLTRIFNQNDSCLIFKSKMKELNLNASDIKT